MQARQLLTDPAVAREFARLQEEAEAKAQEVRRLQEELQAVNFSQESKAGRLLMAKCRALQVSNALRWYLTCPKIHFILAPD